MMTIIDPPDFDKDWQTVAYLEVARAIDNMQKGNWGSALEEIEFASEVIEGSITEEDG